MIAKEKFKPDFFLYENNVSASSAIKDQIKAEFGAWDGTLLTPRDVQYIEINSALVSAQNRQRFYVHNCGDVCPPRDRKIVLSDVLEYCYDWGEMSKVKSECVEEFLQELYNHAKQGVQDDNRATILAQAKECGGGD